VSEGEANDHPTAPSGWSCLPSACGAAPRPAGLSAVLHGRNLWQHTGLKPQSPAPAPVPVTNRVAVYTGRQPCQSSCDNAAGTVPTWAVIWYEGPAMIDQSALSQARRALGHQLAAYRQAAGLKQEELAPLVHYGRS